MIIISSYTILKNQGFYFAVPYDKSPCPFCQGCLKVRGSRRRQVIMEDGNTYVFKLRRLQCQACSKIHLEIPDLMLPYKHYSRKVVLQASMKLSNDCPADDATIYRWRQQNTPVLNGLPADFGVKITCTPKEGR